VIEVMGLPCYQVASSLSSVLSLGGDCDRCSTVAVDLTVGGDEAADGGEAGSAGSLDSNPARAL
jgi:hypothetical protein